MAFRITKQPPRPTDRGEGWTRPADNGNPMKHWSRAQGGKRRIGRGLFRNHSDDEETDQWGKRSSAEHGFRDPGAEEERADACPGGKLTHHHNGEQDPCQRSPRGWGRRLPSALKSGHSRHLEQDWKVIVVLLNEVGDMGRAGPLYEIGPSICRGSFKVYVNKPFCVYKFRPTFYGRCRASETSP